MSQVTTTTTPPVTQNKRRPDDGKEKKNDEQQRSKKCRVDEYAAGVNTLARRFPVAPNGLQRGLHEQSLPYKRLKHGGSGLQRMATKRLAHGLSANMSVGARTEDFASILQSPVACNNHVAVHLDQETSLMQSALAVSFNLFYTAELIEKLFNSYTLLQTHPAGRPDDKTQSQSQTIAILERAYTLDSLRASYDIPAGVIEKIRRHVTGSNRDFELFRQERSSGGNGGMDVAGPVAKNAEEISNDLLRRIHGLIAAEAEVASQSLDLGVIQQAFTVMLSSAIPHALCITLNKFETAIANAQAQSNDIHQWKRSKHREALIDEYVSEYANQLFVMHKRRNPAEVLIDLVATSEDHLQNLTTRETVDPNCNVVDDSMPYDGLSNQPFNVSPGNAVAGVIFVSQHLFKELTMKTLALKKGVRLSKKRVYLQPTKSLLFNKALGGNTVAMVYNDLSSEFSPDDEASVMGQLADLVSDPTPTGALKQNRATMRFTESGKRMFGIGESVAAIERASDPPREGLGVGGEDEIQSARQSEHLLYQVDNLVQPCRYIETAYGRYIVEPAREQVPPSGVTQRKPSMFAPSLVHKLNEMMHVAVGDFDPDNRYIIGWANAIKDKKDGSTLPIDARKLFRVEEVVARTPGIEAQQELRFGAVELTSAVVNPLLYDVQGLQDVLNENYENAARNKGNVRHLHQMYSDTMRAARDAKENFQQYSENSNHRGPTNSLGEAAFNNLQLIEKAPFINVRAEQRRGVGVADAG